MRNAVMIAFGKAKPGKKKVKDGSSKEELSESDAEAIEEGDLDADFMEAAKGAYESENAEDYARALHAAIKACYLADKENSQEGY